MEVRRIWRCPQCGYERRLGGQATAVVCQCNASIFMKLVQEPVFHRPENREVNVYMSPEEIIGDEEFPVEATDTALTEAEPQSTSPADVVPSVPLPTDVTATDADLTNTCSTAPPSSDGPLPVGDASPAQTDFKTDGEAESEGVADEDFGVGVVDDEHSSTEENTRRDSVVAAPDAPQQTSPSAASSASAGDKSAGSKRRRSRGRRKGRSGGSDRGGSDRGGSDT